MNRERYERWWRTRRETNCQVCAGHDAAIVELIERGMPGHVVDSARLAWEAHRLRVHPRHTATRERVS